MNKKSKIIAGGILITGAIGATSFAIIDPYNLMSKKNIETPEKSLNVLESTTKEKDKKEIDGLNLNGIKDGTYLGVSKGYGGDIKVKVTIENSKIKNIEVVSHSETPKYYENGSKIIEAILKENSTNVDAISGATLTSNGIKNAVKDALSKAGFNIDTNNEESSILKNYSDVRYIKDKNYTNNIKNMDLREYKLEDGKYIGEAIGFKGNVKVQITIKNGTLVNVQIINHNDDEEFFNKAKTVIIKILKNQTTAGVDTISGATYSSRGILNAVTKALNNATKKENILSDMSTSSAGSSVFEKDNDKLNNEPKENVEEPKDNEDKKATEPTKQDYSKYVLPDGEYNGKAAGYGGIIAVTVKVENGVISKVTVDSHNETPIYYEKVSEIFGEIVKNNSTGIDTVSGATVTSKGILSAVEDALSKVKGEERKEYSEGTWYGQGRGHYSYDSESYGERRTATEAKVTIKDGKILEAKLVNHGDDEGFEKLEGYELIEKHIIKNSSTKGIMEILANKDRNEPIYDAVSGATNSARGFVNAIDDALNRSVKFKKDGISQEIRGITLKERPFASIEYGEEVNLKDFVVKVTYLDGHVEDVPFANLKDKGIECNLPMIFIPEPEDKNHYDKYRNYVLTFTDKKSTSKHSSELQARRKVVYKEISEIVLETKDGDSYKVPVSNKFRYTVDLKEGEFKEITKVKVFDSNHELVSVEKFKLESYDLPTLYVDLKPLEMAKPSDKTNELYRNSGYRIEFKVNAEFNKDKIQSFRIDSKPSKLEYFTGEKLNLNGLTITATDSNYVKKKIEFFDLGNDSFKENGFIIEPKTGIDLNKPGTVKISIKHNNPEIQEQTFNIEVKERTELPSKIVIQNSKDEIVKTIKLKDGQRVYHGVKIPKKYKTESLKIKVYSEKEEEIKPHEVKFKPGSKLLQVYFTEDTYAFLGMVYED